MISALKHVAAAAIVALFGGLLFVSLPTDQGTIPIAPGAVSTSPTPSTSVAETDDGDRTNPAYFAGDLDFTAGTGGCMAIAEGGFCSRTYSIASDVTGARLAGGGEAHTMWPFEGGHPGPHEGSLRIENEHGAWSGVLAPRGRFDDHYGVWFVGEDGYEGLTAFMYATAVTIEGAREDMHWQVDGWLFTDEPVAPPPPAEE